MPTGAGCRTGLWVTAACHAGFRVPAMTAIDRRNSEEANRVTDRGAVLARLIELASLSVTDGPLPLRLSRACRDILAADGVSLSFLDSTAGPITLAATDEVAARLGDLEDVAGEGPATEAFSAGEDVEVALGEVPAERWPGFTRAAVAAVGPVMIRALPMLPDGHRFGVITTYVVDGRELAQDQLTTRFLANAVGAALLQDAPERLSGRRRDSWLSRSHIHQATGMVIAQLGLPPEDALAMLRAHAYAHDQPLTDVAEQIVSRRLHFGRTDHEGS
jgi:hypothetical protein